MKAHMIITHRLLKSLESGNIYTWGVYHHEIWLLWVVSNLIKDRCAGMCLIASGFQSFSQILYDQ